jgi:hypothetical protein
MDVVEAIGESPASLATVVLTVIVVVGREVALASGNAQAARIVRALWPPYLGLLAIFVVIVATRIVLIAR